ncbi:MAG: phosphoribosylanthranilate isomerase [Andreesenia angusta]|nr:phosphoribosylanthranilate isomerase [Andreesenia angusta]
MTKVKICGLKREEDIKYINEIKSDYIGFIFAKSSRKVSIDQAKALNELLDIDIQSVGVFVNENIENIIRTYEEVKLDIVQLHGDESIDYIEEIPEYIDIWKAIRVKDESDIERAQMYSRISKVKGILLDAYSEKAYGGLGISFNWNIIKRNFEKPLILAGGIDINNVEEAIRIVEPDIIDVSSGVEINKVKDYNKIREFVQKVRKI